MVAISCDARKGLASAMSALGQKRTSWGFSSRNLAAPRRLDCGDVDLSHTHHRFKGALCFSAPGRHRFHQDTRRDLPRHAPLVFAPAARAFLPAIADDRVPIAIRLVLIVSSDLKRKRFIMFERRTAVEADTGDASNFELDHQHISLLAGWKVAGCTVHGAHGAVGKGFGIKSGGVLGILIVPETNCILGHCMSFRSEAPGIHPLVKIGCQSPFSTEKRGHAQPACALQVTKEMYSASSNVR